MDIERDFVQLARLATTGTVEDVRLLMHRVLPLLGERRPDLAPEITAVLAGTSSGRPTKSKEVKELRPLPVDLDSRLELLYREEHPELPVEPTWPSLILTELNQFISERTQEDRLIARGIMPTRSLLLVGPPGVGKSLAARYLAVQLSRPLLTLDLAAVMSSFLGRTGNNIRAVLDYARNTSGILLLDEFDAIAKRRDDATDVGELKRLVTVLLQAIDDWPRTGILLAATNHPDLLDPAVWRRFDRVIHFPFPSADEIGRAMTVMLKEDTQTISRVTLDTLAILFEGRSFADVRKTILRAQRESLINHLPIEQVLKGMIPKLLEGQPRKRKIEIAVSLHSKGWTERTVNELTGVARDTFRKRSLRKTTPRRGTHAAKA
ncbi:MAG: ATP-binding protein [Acidobacteria bacterium]|nr:ATP-binding protein [Acidobacteriota bacterium]